MKYHPDRNRTKSDAEQDEASKKFKDIAEAYGVLSDKDKRKKYDKFLRFCQLQSFNSKNSSCHPHISVIKQLVQIIETT